MVQQINNDITVRKYKVIHKYHADIWTQYKYFVQITVNVSSYRRFRIKSFNMPRDVSSYLSEQQRKSTGEAASDWAQIEEFYNKKYEYVIQ